MDSVIKLLSLEKCRATRVGNEFKRGISGGEKKRTNIGIELIGMPSLIFMDEPTTGLDTSTAYDVMKITKDMTKDGRTIITTIHQPSHEILECFDNIICLCKGHMIYNGSPKKVMAYFSNIGYTIPPFTNPADFLMRIVNDHDIHLENSNYRRNNKAKVIKETCEALLSKNEKLPTQDDPEVKKIVNEKMLEMAKTDPKLKKLSYEEVQ